MELNGNHIKLLHHEEQQPQQQGFYERSSPLDLQLQFCFFFFFVVVPICLIGDVIRDHVIANEFLFMESIPFLEHPLDDYHLFPFFFYEPTKIFS
jgi:hypothetical protein